MKTMACTDMMPFTPAAASDSRATFAVHVQLCVLLEGPQCKIGAVAEIAITSPGAQVVTQLQQHLLHQLHVLPLAAVLDDAISQRIFHRMDRPLILAAVREHDNGVPVSFRDKNVATAQVRGLALVLAAGQLGESPGLVQVAGHVARPEALGQAGDTREGDADAHQRRAVRLTGRSDLRRVKAQGLRHLYSVFLWYWS